jgi:thioredoxin reductase (NADPH)
MTKKFMPKTIIISTGASAKYLGIPSEQHYLQTGGGVSLHALFATDFQKSRSSNR